MEVHHHPHVEKKNFKEYFLEFLMIFLAVTMGFIAENIREYFVDKEMELKYVEAFVRDLKSDTSNINWVLKGNMIKEGAYDSLLMLSNEDLMLPKVSKEFIQCFLDGTFTPLSQPSNFAIIQLENTGSLRLIKHKGALDSILTYNQHAQRISVHNEAIIEDHGKVWEFAYPVIKVKIFRDSTFTDFKSLYYKGRVLTAKPTPPLNLDPEKLDIFLGHITRALNLNQVNRALIQDQLQRANRMIDFFDKEYNLNK